MRPRLRTLLRSPLRAAVALLFGCTIAGGILGLAEARQRRREAGHYVRVPDLKYAAELADGTTHSGWMEGLAPPARRYGTRRILCVGDSVTEGAGVGTLEAWPAQLRRKLGRSRNEVFNFGVNGWDASQVATLIETRLAPWDPDLIIWGTYANDIVETQVLVASSSGDRVYVGHTVPDDVRLLPEPLSRPLLLHSALFRSVQADAYMRYVGTPASGTWYREQVDRIERWSSATGVPVLMVAIPAHVLTGVCVDRKFCDVATSWFGIVTDALSSHASHWLDGSVAWRGQGPFYLPGSTDPDHPNAEAHGLLAEHIAPTAAMLMGPAGAP